MTTSDTIPEIDPARMSSHTYRICNKTSFVKCCNYNWLHPIGDANWIDWDFICDWTFFSSELVCANSRNLLTGKYTRSHQLSSAHLFCPVSTYCWLAVFHCWPKPVIQFNAARGWGGSENLPYSSPRVLFGGVGEKRRVCGCVYVWEIVDWALSHWLPRLWLWRRRWRENPINEEKCPSSTIGWVG